jgi:hypothetical protein
VQNKPPHWWSGWPKPLKSRSLVNYLAKIRTLCYNYQNRQSEERRGEERRGEEKGEQQNFLFGFAVSR